MKKINISFLILSISLLVSTGCKKDWLERQSKSLITDDQVWNDPKQILALLANYYDRLPTDMGLRDNTNPEQWRNMADYDDAIWSGYSGEDGRNNIVSYATDRWRLWN